jgi:hypothetical protein
MTGSFRSPSGGREAGGRGLDVVDVREQGWQGAAMRSSSKRPIASDESSSRTMETGPPAGGDLA